MLHKITPRGKSGRGSGLRKLLKILGFPFNISATAEASNFKFGVQLRFAKAHHKITPREKSGRGPALLELPKISGFPFNISPTAEASDFKFGMQLGFAKSGRTNRLAYVAVTSF